MSAGPHFRRAFEIGWESVRANRMPIVMLWAMSVVMVAAYGSVPQVRTVLDFVADWQRRYRFLSAFVSFAFFCGILPGVFLFAVRSIRPERPVLTIVAQTIWNGMFGIATEEVFRLLAVWFGDDASFRTLVLKTLADQFVWTVLVVAPVNAVFSFWLGRDLSFARVRREMPRNLVARVCLPNLVMNWCVWIPVIFMVFSFPQPLQVFVCGFACAFWSLMCLQIGRRS